MEGENLTTNLLIMIPQSLRDYDYYLEFLCPNDRSYATTKIDLNEGSLYFPVPYEVLRDEGRVDVQVVARLDMEDELIFKSSKANFMVSQSICADRFLSDEFYDAIKSSEEATQESIQATAECNEATAQSQAATSSAIQATQDATEAKKNAINVTLTANNTIAIMNDSITHCNQARDNANNAAQSVHNAIDLAESATIATNNAKDNAQAAANAALQAADSANNATDEVNSSLAIAQNVINDVNDALNQSQNVVTQISNALIEANNVKQLATDALNTADTAVSNANNATQTAIDASNNANQVRQLMQEMYDNITYDLENNIFDGKSAYQYAQEAGFSGSEEEFANQLASINSNTTIDDGKYTEVIRSEFNDTDNHLLQSKKDAKISVASLYADNTIKQNPVNYIADYVVPQDTSLTIEIKNNLAEIPLNSINISLPYPLYSLDDIKDKLVYDNDEKKFYIVYRTQCIDLSEIDFIFLPLATPNTIHACYGATNFGLNISKSDLKFKCGPLPYRNDMELNNNDMLGISIYETLGGIYCYLRMPRTLVSDTSEINNFLSANSHKIIIKLDEEIKIPLSDENNDILNALIAYSPNTYIKAYSQDNQYIIKGTYTVDTGLLIDTKASLIEDNSLTGNQYVNGNVEVVGNLSTTQDYLTLRKGANNDIGSGKVGIEFKAVDGNNNSKFEMDRYGRAYAGLSGSMRMLAERDSNPKNLSFAYWDETLNCLNTHSNYKTTTFLRQVISNTLVLSTINWINQGDYYQYVINYGSIKASSFVLISYEDDSKLTAQEAGIGLFNPIVEDDYITIKASSAPTQDISIKLIIIGA